MTRAASDCTSEHEKNYFDSRLMSDIGIFQHLSGGLLVGYACVVDTDTGEGAERRPAESLNAVFRQYRGNATLGGEHIQT